MSNRQNLTVLTGKPYYVRGSGINEVGRHVRYKNIKLNNNNNSHKLATLVNKQYLPRNGQIGKGFDLQKVLRKVERFLPKDMLTLPKHRYTGIQSTPLEDELDENDNPLPGHDPYNQIDELALHHDVCYRDSDSKKGKHLCDDIMLRDLKKLKPKNFREKVDRKVVQAVIGTKRKLGFGLSKTQQKILKNL